LVNEAGERTDWISLTHIDLALIPQKSPFPTDCIAVAQSFQFVHGCVMVCLDPINLSLGVVSTQKHLNIVNILVYIHVYTHLKDYYFSLMQLSNQPITCQLLQCIYLWVWSWSRQSPELQTECQNGKER